MCAFSQRLLSEQVSLVCLSAVNYLKVLSVSYTESGSSLSAGGAVLVWVSRGDCWCGGRLGTSSTAPRPSQPLGCPFATPGSQCSALGQQFSLRRQRTSQGCSSTLTRGLRGSGSSLDLPEVFQRGFVELLRGEGGSSLDPDHASAPGDAPEGEPSPEAPVSQQPSSHCLGSAAHPG